MPDAERKHRRHFLNRSGYHPSDGKIFLLLTLFQSREMLCSPGRCAAFHLDPASRAHLLLSAAGGALNPPASVYPRRAAINSAEIAHHYRRGIVTGPESCLEWRCGGFTVGWRWEVAGDWVETPQLWLRYRCLGSAESPGRAASCLCVEWERGPRSGGTVLTPSFGECHLSYLWARGAVR